MFALSLNAENITKIFGSGTNAFSVEFVEIGEPGNSPDLSGLPIPAGSVGYTYYIGKYEISRESIDKANNEGLLGLSMMTTGDNSAKKPAGGLSWYEAAKFINWLNVSTGHSAAYNFDNDGNFQLWSPTDNGYDVSNQYRNKNAIYVLPSADEWYKAAYGSPNGDWFNYPTGSDIAPTAVNGGTNSNTAVYNGSVIADIDNAGGLSAYGTMAQGGNLREMIETAWDKGNNSPNENRTVRGGPWYNPLNNLDSSNQFFLDPTSKENRNGFRVVIVQSSSSGNITNNFAVIMQKSNDLNSWVDISTNSFTDTNTKTFFRLKIKQQ